MVLGSQNLPILSRPFIPFASPGTVASSDVDLCIALNPDIRTIQSDRLYGLDQ